MGLPSRNHGLQWRGEEVSAQSVSSWSGEHWRVLGGKERETKAGSLVRGVREGEAQEEWGLARQAHGSHGDPEPARGHPKWPEIVRGLLLHAMLRTLYFHPAHKGRNH